MDGHTELNLPPRDDAAYLVVDERWRIIAADDSGALAPESGAMALVGQEARDVVGPEALAHLQRHGVAAFSLDGVDYVLAASTFRIPAGVVRVIRVQEMHSTLEHMLSLVVHELRNPLSAIRALVQGLEEEVGSAPRAVVYTQRIAGEIDRLGRLLASMAQVARPGTRPLEILQPGEVLERAAATFRPDLERRGIALAVHVTPRAGPIYTDPDQIQQVLINLVANAVEAMPHGGTLTLRARLDPRGRPVLQVEDTGVGMRPDALERALRPRQTTKPGGMGLGLTIVYSIVRQHSGRMRIASLPDKGTTVSITFPTIEYTASGAQT